MKTTLLLLAIVCSTATVFSQLSLSGEFRPRTEMSHGYGSLSALNQLPSLFTSQRTRLNVHFAKDNYTTKLVLQDVRIWGSQKQLVLNEDFATSVHEAWVQVPLVKKLFLKAGRMELVYDDHRIFGNVAWTQQARSHDLALLKYENKVNMHLGLAYHENTTRTNNFYDGPDAYKAMQFIWLNKKSEHVAISFILLNNGLPHVDLKDTAGAMLEQGIQYSQTVGPRVVYAKDKLTVAGSGYYQMGKDGKDKKLNAYEVALDLGYKINDFFNVNIGYELLSGTSQTDATNLENNSFTPFYGTNHKFNGFMDYFFVGNHTNSVGLQDIYAKGHYEKEKLFSDLHLHLFSAAAAIADPMNSTKKISSGLGTEVDFSVGYKMSADVKWIAGYSQLFATSSLEILKGGNKDATHNWAYLMIAVTPEFLK